MIAGLSIMCGSLILVAASFFAKVSLSINRTSFVYSWVTIQDPFANGIIAIVGIGVFLFGFETGPGYVGYLFHAQFVWLIMRQN